MKRFNVTGLCLPERDYMCDISGKVSQIVAMVERGNYFTINRARQYGKTTVIRQLEKVLLEKGYRVARISFEGIGDTPFENEENFCQNIIDQISRAIDMTNPEYAKAWINNSIKTYKELDVFLDEICKDTKVVLIIDETDKTSNNLVFLRFIGMLRDKYLERGNPKRATFQSVILAEVYDIRNLKLKMVQTETHQLQDDEKRINSLWNIAINFKVDMSLNEEEIASMLREYEDDNKTGMDINVIAKEIRTYTSGYPYLVSRICQSIEEDLDRDWTINGVGFYHLESETRDGERTDVIVELKLWYGEASHEKALEQLTGYLDGKNKDAGYLLTFDFRKEDNTGKPQAKWVEHNGKRIFDCVAGV